MRVMPRLRTGLAFAQREVVVSQKTLRRQLDGIHCRQIKALFTLKEKLVIAFLMVAASCEMQNRLRTISASQLYKVEVMLNSLSVCASKKELESAKTKTSKRQLSGIAWHLSEARKRRFTFVWADCMNTAEACRRIWKRIFACIVFPLKAATLRLNLVPITCLNQKGSNKKSIDERQSARIKFVSCIVHMKLYIVNMCENRCV